MKNPLIKKLLGKHSPGAFNFGELIQQLHNIRTASANVAIVPQPTGANWLGIHNATRQLFPKNTLVLPQHYSNPQLTNDQLNTLMMEAGQLNFKNVVLSGYPTYFSKIVEALKKSGGTNIDLLMHGTFTELGYGGKASEGIVAPLAMAQQGYINKIGVIRNDLAAFIQQQWDVKTFPIKNKCLVETALDITAKDNSTAYIGVLGADNFNKNLHNQVAGAALVKGSKIFVSNSEPFSYLSGANIQSSGKLDHHRFISLLASMDVNMHLSFSESWGQVAAESLALGVPCLVSPNTNLLDDNGYLKNKLTVVKTDSPVHIAAHIQSVLNEKQELSALCKEYIAGLNARADVLLNEFLESE